MMRRLLNLIIYVALAASASAQVKVTGRVIDLQNKPVSDVIVKLISGSKTLAFTSSNAQGVYSLDLKNAPSGMVTLQFSHISYEKESERLTLKEKVTRVDMSLTPKNISLKEVTVKPNPLRQMGDTLSHNLAAFLGKGDVTLEDGLKRLPGVDVSKAGTISYMGKPISQFNIEGMDLLGGKYNLATRNIRADYVTNVEIVRNFHARKVDSDKPSDDVALNIRLNKKAKFKPFGQEEAGVGVRLGLLGLTGMMFTDRFQTICSLKGGNYKDFARADLYDHFGSSDIKTPATSLFGGFDGGSPPQSEYLHQRNAMTTLNAIQRLDSATTVKVNADYSYHRATHDISQSTTYLAGNDSYVTVSEQTSPLTKVHLPKLTVSYLRNADRKYLSETFVLKGKFERNEGDVLADGSQIEQRRHTSSFEVGNQLYWAGKTEHGKRRHLEAAVSFKQTPTLRLTFSLTPSPSPNGEGSQSLTAYGQTAQSSALSMNVGSSFNIPIGKVFRINLPVKVTAIYDNLETIYSPPSQGEGEAVRGYVRGWNLTPTANPGFEIHSRNRRFYLSTGLGATLKGLYYNRMNYTKPVLNPTASISYTFSANSKLSLSSGYSTQIGDMLTLLTEPMQVDYRTQRTSSGIIGESGEWSTSAGWKWQLPMQYFTFSLAATHSESKRNTLPSQHVSGMNLNTSTLLRDSHSRATSFSVSSTKNIPSLFSKFTIDATYGFGDSEQAVDEAILETRHSTLSLHGSAAITPLPFLELRHDSRYSLTSTRSVSSVPNLSRQSLTSLHLFPHPALDLSLRCDHARRQLTTDTYKHTTLFDASAQYKWKRAVLRLELDNLLNQRTYAYTVFDGINTYSYSYALLGRTLFARITLNL